MIRFLRGVAAFLLGLAVCLAGLFVLGLVAVYLIGLLALNALRGVFRGGERKIRRRDDRIITLHEHEGPGGRFTWTRSETDN